MTVTEKALRDALHAEGTSYAVSPDAWARVQARAAARRARRRRAVPVAAAAVTAGIAAAALVPGLAAGGDARPTVAVAPVPSGPGDKQVAQIVPRLCAGDRPARENANLLARAGALPVPGGGGWLVAIGDGTGGLRFLRVTGGGGRLDCRAYAASRTGTRTYASYAGARGRGEVSWTGVTSAAAVAFEVRYADGTRLRFACDGDTAGCARRATAKGWVTVFTTRPRRYTPPEPGAPVHGVVTVLGAGGKVLERLPFSAG
ncbi:hypothetical protein E1264_06695 [Actinomadura sp. KC216]|uniref:hypothetical protein n=1 Tax=Actinomadura sp. KC216 TaxID=2530370 RepID=UPI0010448C37|nr:hypothetical protein [Actinomadura sp. KC216]TDB89894.1 hypothetical protein E1264_06695 [Actinomadura sp. KC216]